MKTIDKPGPNRLAKFISLLFGYVGVYFSTTAGGRSGDTTDLILIIIFIGSAVAYLIYLFIGLIYWVIDGFNEPNDG